MNENNSPLGRLLDWCAGHVAAIRYSYQPPSTGEIDDDEVRQEIEQVEADMRAVERDHRSLVDAYGAAIQELQRRGAKSVPLTPSIARLRDLLGGYECPKCGGSGRIPVIDLGVGEVIDKVPCPVCRPDDTPRRDALEALRRLEELAIADSHNRSPYDIGRDAGTVRRALEQQNSAENKHSYAVPESLLAPEKIVDSRAQIKWWEGMRLRVDFGVDADWTSRIARTALAFHDLKDALAQNSEPGRVDDTARLDKLERLGDPGVPWIARQSSRGRGYRLHQSWSHAAVQPTVREAIDAAPEPEGEGG